MAYAPTNASEEDVKEDFLQKAKVLAIEAQKEQKVRDTEYVPNLAEFFKSIEESVEESIKEKFSLEETNLKPLLSEFEKEILKKMEKKQNK